MNKQINMDLDALEPHMDIEGIRSGYFTDAYFLNIQKILESMSDSTFLSLNPINGNGYQVSDAQVEMQWFTRRPGQTLVCGLNLALACLKNCSGYWEGGKFIDTADSLEVWAVPEGSFVDYQGDPSAVMPVLRVRGRYRDFGGNETVTLGYLARASRVATNVYELLIATHGKPLLFFPARYDLPETQTIDGYAYGTAVKTYNEKFGKNLPSFVSTDAQGALLGVKGGGTIPHAAIACFLGDTVKTTMAFAKFIDPAIPRVALVDFDNDCVNTSKNVAQSLFREYIACVRRGNDEEAKRFKLFGVRLDTSSALIDKSLVPMGEKREDYGVNPRLVHAVRNGLDDAWREWGLAQDDIPLAKTYLREVKIIVSGGFNKDKIRWFEETNTPVDMYAVGSATFDNHGPTVTDYTADVVQVKIGDEWTPMAKVGRKPNENPELVRVW
ncbi:MAG TPA: nicotinate phosphoribosyltransferase [Chloroflexi bacterium]|nr:nicotinate phosphoribosyltransferase [Chloroflexota bacterium]